ncbi:MAG: DUF1080 domain-containing protein [Planctomycetes bacterium]|nr:DUF1080 domain-containing protein [Planctomycetota bacterium]
MEQVTMPNTKPCPTSDELQSFLLGEAVDEVMQAIAEHVDTCLECQTTLDQFSKQDEVLVAELGQAIPVGAEDDAEMQRLLTLASKLPLASRRRDASSEAGSEFIDESGTQLGQYQLAEKLGEGGMGVVYKATHLQLKRSVALKVLAPRWNQDAEASSRFQREIESAGRLDHPNIVRPTDAGEADGRHYLVMEFVDGLDLATLVNRLGPLRVADACELARQTAIGLQHAHEHKLVHRDIKPSNMMIRVESPTGQAAKGVVKILDFGLTRLRESELTEQELTSRNQVMGTADYMAPEQATSPHQVDIRADLYSLGCTLYKLLTGEAPFTAAAYPSAFERMQAHAQQPPPLFSDHRADAPETLDQLMNQLLAKSPADRFQNPLEVANALEEFTQGTDLPALVHRAIETADVGLQDRETASRKRNATDVHEQPDRRQKANVSRLRTVPGLISLAVLAIVILYFSPQIIRITTNHGLLILQVDAPDVEITIREGDTIIHDRITDRRISLRAGEYEIEVRELPEGLRFFADEFQIVRGGRAVVTAKLESVEPHEQHFTPTRPHNTLTAAEVAEGWKLLFDGETTTGWHRSKGPKGDGVAGWRVENGILSAGRKNNYLVTDEEFSDFELQLDWKISHSGNSGIFYRVVEEHGIVETGPEFQILDDVGNPLGEDSTRRSGAVYGLFEPKSDVVRPVGEWNHIRIIVDGNRVEHWMNGTKLIEYELLSTDWQRHVENGARNPQMYGRAQNGKIALQDHNTDAWFRNIKIRPLTDNSSPQANWKPDSPESVLPGLIPLPATLPGIKRWQIETVAPRSAILSVDWSLKDNLIACGTTTGCVRVYNAKSFQLVNIFPGHSSRVVSVAFSPDGTRLASGSADGSVKVWNLDDSSVLTKDGFEGTVWSVAWNADGSRLAAASHDGTVRILERDLALSAVLRHSKRSCTSVAWHPSKPLLVTAGSGTVQLWAVNGVKLKRLAFGDPRLVWWMKAAWSPDGKHMAIADTHSLSLRPRIRLLDWTADGRLENETTVVTLNREWLDEIAWSDDSQWLAYSYHGVDHRKKAIGFINSIGEPGATISNTVSERWSIAWKPGESLLAAGTGSGSLEVWDSSGTPQDTLPGHTSEVSSVSWSPKSQQMAVSGGHDSSVRVFGNNGRAGPVLDSHEDVVYDSTWSLDGLYVASRSRDQYASIWKPGQPARMIKFGGTHGPGVMQWHPDSRSFISCRGHIGMAHGGPNATSWDTNGESPRTYKCHGGSIMAAVWSPDGEQLVTAGQYGDLRLWSVDGSSMRHLDEHVDLRWRRHIDQAAWRPTGDQFVTSEHGAAVRFWSKDGLLEETKLRREYRLGTRCLAWSPDGQFLAVAWNCDDTKAIWDKSFSLWHETDGEKPVTGTEIGGVRDLSWSPDSRQVASCGEQDGTIRIWNVETKARFLLPSTAGGFCSVAWSPDGDQIVAGSVGSALYAWNALTGEPQWVSVRLNNRQSLTFSAAGRLSYGDRSLADKELVYVVENANGVVELVKPSDFATRIGQSIQMLP